MYKKDDYIAFMTKQPHVHVNEMFGYNSLTEDDFEKKEYKGIILDVVDFDGPGLKVYTVKTLSPLDGFICLFIGEEDILRKVELCEIEEDRKKWNEQVSRMVKTIPQKQKTKITKKKANTMEGKNESTERLSINALLATDEYQKTTMQLPCAIGVVGEKEPLLFDLAKMPHILIGGATGYGKSNTMHAILASLLQKKSPEELKLVLIDPKKVEFTGYEPLSSNYLARLPYHEADESIITNVEDAVNTLCSLDELMTQRYHILMEYGCKNINDYNEKLKAGKILPEPSCGPMPYYVVMIDEYSDLIMTAGIDFERPLTRIAQLSRAVGIHLVIATQRLSYSVLTGAIQANFPCRIAFKTMTKKDSKMILERPGAEQLSGAGDMLIICGGEPVHVHGVFVDYFNDIPALCAKLELQYPNYKPTLLPRPKREPEKVETDLKSIGKFVFQYDDSLFEDVATAMVENQLASVSFIQRKFKIGYNRAVRLLDMAESAGIVGHPDEGTYVREVLIADTNSLTHKLLDIKKEIYKKMESKE